MIDFTSRGFVALSSALALTLACMSCAPAPAHDALPVGSTRAYALDALVGAPRHRDVARGLVLLRVACGRGELRACVERALALEIYDGRASALGEAWRLLEDACQRPTKTTCENDPAAQSGRNAQSAQAGNAFTRSDICGKNSVEMLACYNLSELFARGLVTAQDSVDSDVLKKRACAGGFKRACE